MQKKNGAEQISVCPAPIPESRLPAVCGVRHADARLLRIELRQAVPVRLNISCVMRRISERLHTAAVSGSFKIA